MSFRACETHLVNNGMAVCRSDATMTHLGRNLALTSSTSSSKHRLSILGRLHDDSFSNAARAELLRNT